ncbi:LysE family translocator [Roseospira navarrensis]|uniref:LysE family translocator n=1 Tax=Roseospira navarrensis TaxID=140058 RepID=A0A7X1ZH43_9PROT|nr:LysE family translocator [Roseospira navarrensis]MQX37155.1 LysE family translocator [Roseospira navarrensis]
MSLDLWLMFLVASVGLSLTPGPNGLLSLTHGARFGLGRTAFTALGAGVGFLVLIAASLAGLGALMAASEQAFTIAKWIGGGYLICLGIRLWRAPAPVIGVVDDAAPALGRDAQGARLFAQGFTVAVSNPKVLIFFAAFLPQFMTPGLGFWPHLLILGGTFVTIEVAYELLLAGTAHRLSPWLAKGGRWFNRVTGTTFIGVGGLLATAGRA